MGHLWTTTRIAALLLCFVLSTTTTFAASVDGYVRRDGTYVQPYQRSAPDGIRENNYGYPGNYNTNTGRLTPEPRQEPSPQPGRLWPAPRR